MLVFAHDYETTGVDTAKLGVVQSALCFATLHQNGSFTILEKDVQVLDPGHPIPAGASGVHGIYDHHVIGKPMWEDYLAEQFKVMTIPSLFVFQNGEHGEAIIAPGSKAQIEEFMRAQGAL